MRDEFEKLKALSEPWKAHMNKISQDIKDAETLLTDMGAPSSVSIKIHYEPEDVDFYMSFQNKKIRIDAFNPSSFSSALIDVKFEHREYFHRYLGEFLIAVHQYIKERI